MRDLLRVLAISGAFAVAAAVAHADVSTPIPDADLKKALSAVKSSWRDYAQCERAKLCSVDFESFGVGLTFNDGTIAPFAHAQRLSASGHDCILNARAALERGDKSMAVQWVMAAQLQEPLTRNWLGDHPDAVLAALQRCCG
jgi:hypothetical protein